MNIYLIIGLSLLTLFSIISAFIFINRNKQGNNQDNNIKDLKILEILYSTGVCTDTEKFSNCFVDKMINKFGYLKVKDFFNNKLTNEIQDYANQLLIECNCNNQLQPPVNPPVNPQLTNTFLIKESNLNNTSSKLYSIFHGNSSNVSCNNYTNMFDILNQPLNTDGNINKCILDSVINLYYNNPSNMGFIIFYKVFTDNKDIKFNFKLITLFQNTFTIDAIEMISPTMDIQYYDNFTNKNISNINIKYDNNGFSWTDTSKQDDITNNVYKKITNVFAFSITGLNYTNNYLIIGDE